MKLFTKRRLTAALSAVMAAFIFVPFAVALTLPFSEPARVFNTEQTHYFRKTVTISDANLLAGYKFGAIPPGTFITSIKCYVTTVFNAATTNPIQIGSTQAGADILAGGAVAGTNCVTSTLGFQSITAAAGLGMSVAAPATPTGSTGGFDLWVKYIPTGGGQTTGSVTFVIEYAPNNDG
jgi:hypothetical protein